MNQKDYNCSITANISAKEAVGGISRVSEWWVVNTEGHSQKLNDVFKVSFGKPSFVTFKLIEVVPDKKVVWLVTECNLDFLKDKTEWTGTKVIWEISPENNSTKIKMTHVGIVPEVECYDSCVKGWDHYVKESLFKLLTEGKGLPAK